MFGIGSLFARSPFARLLAVIVVDFFVARGWIDASQVSQAVEDAINVISFSAIVVYLAIWQWRHHHPAKAHIDAEIPISPEQTQQEAHLRRGVIDVARSFLNKLSNSIVEKPQA